MQHQLLEKAQENLGVVLDSPQDSKELASMLLKIADNCTSNLTVQQYVFTRIEEILGLGVDFGDADIDVFGPKVRIFCNSRKCSFFSPRIEMKPIS